MLRLKSSQLRRELANSISVELEWRRSELENNSFSENFVFFFLILGAFQKIFFVKLKCNEPKVK